jgi:hypothetical protein
MTTRSELSSMVSLKVSGLYQMAFSNDTLPVRSAKNVRTHQYIERRQPAGNKLKVLAPLAHRTSVIHAT